MKFKLSVGELADAIAKEFVCDVRANAFRHGSPCGPRRDPGQRDDFGRRWHNCWSIEVDSVEVFVGREPEAAAFLDGLRMGLY